MFLSKEYATYIAKKTIELGKEDNDDDNSKYYSGKRQDNYFLFLHSRRNLIFMWNELLFLLLKLAPFFTTLFSLYANMKMNFQVPY